MIRPIEWWTAAAFLLVCAALLALLALFSIYEAPNVVACLEYENPAMSVEVTSNRAGGHIVERRDIFGCTWYWYEGKGGGD